MIKKIWLRNYGPFENAELALEPLTVIVGPNASGKSIALKALLDPLAGKLPELAGDVLAPMRKMGSEPDAVELGCETQDDRGFELRYPSDMRSNSVRVRLKYLPKALLLRLESDVLRQASYLPLEKPLMRSDGYGLATVLADMKLSDNRYVSMILRHWSTVISVEIVGSSWVRPARVAQRPRGWCRGQRPCQLGFSDRPRPAGTASS